MPTFRFAKLVRDNIVDQQLASGMKPLFYKLESAEHKDALIDKLVEETVELKHATADKFVAELADLQQALDDLRILYGISKEQVAQAQAQRNRQVGSFSKGIYVESVDAAEDSQWVEYFRKNPDHYPEIN
ncbi:MAG TPA: nucleoside triphosphate pyrophosphohydrolase [Candidatus Saccharimonadia bacterium]